MVWLTMLALASAGAFLFYGYETLFTHPPRGEYDRFGMPGVRVFVGSAQLLGAGGVLVGLGVPLVGAAAAAGLTTMMLLGLIVRYRIRDAPRLMMPAATLAMMNAVLCAAFILR